VNSHPDLWLSVNIQIVFQKERVMKSDHPEFKESARKPPTADNAKIGGLHLRRRKKESMGINFLTNLGMLLSMVSGGTAAAAEYRPMINPEEHSELVRRLLHDASTDEPSNVRLRKGESAALQKNPKKAGGKNVPLQKRRAENSPSTGETVGPVCTKKYKLTDLGTLGGSESFAYAINNSGAIVGEARTEGDSTTHAFLYHKGVMTDLSPLNSQSIRTAGPTGINARGQIASGSIANNIYRPAILDAKTRRITPLGSFGGVTSDGFNGVATSINKFGQAVGYSHIDDINRHAFLYSNGAMTDLGSFGGYSGANAINDKGMVVGFASDQVNGKAHAFLYADGVMTDIDPFLDFSTSESDAHDINNRGQVVGEFLTEDQSATHAFIYGKQGFTDIGSEDSPYTVALGINDREQIVGITDVPYQGICFDLNQGTIPCIKFKQHAFIYEKGRLTDLDTLVAPDDDWELMWAFDINNRGKIVGYGLNQGKFRAFLLTPTGRRCQ
jgi:probable HAF family extracellular repeat protein